jgi:hypothetical protein
MPSFACRVGEQSYWGEIGSGMDFSEYDFTDDISLFISDMSDAKAQLLHQRCEKALLKLDDPASTEEAADVCIHEVKMMYMSDLLNTLQAKGLVKVTGINEAGELIYKAVKPGASAASS